MRTRQALCRPSSGRLSRQIFMLLALWGVWALGRRSLLEQVFLRLHIWHVGLLAVLKRGGLAVRARLTPLN
jgi:hypothetical protein